MKIGVSHDTAKTKADKGMRIMIWDMNPRTLGLKTGQVFVIRKKDPKTGEQWDRSVQIKTLYPHHVLCRVSGSFSECFTYSELYMMGVGKIGKT